MTGGKVSSGDGVAATAGRLALKGLAFALVAFALASCIRTYTWNQKVTLVVDTPHGEVSGSAVQRVRYAMYVVKPSTFPKDGWELVRGEAVVVDLGDGKYLFGLLQGEMLQERHPAMLLELLILEKDRSRAREYPAAATKVPVGTRYRITDRYLPLLVTFTDIDDPKTVKRVDPWDMDAAFGCDRDTGPKPWREKGISVRLWHKQQMALRAAREITKEMGLPPEAGELLARMQFSRAAEDLDDIMKGAARPLVGDEWDAARARLKALGVGRDAQYAWETRFLARYRELAALPPRDTSRDCYRLKAAWVEVTDEPATSGKVEKVLGWWHTLRGGPYNSMKPLRLPNNSPRGWDNLSASAFWSLDIIQEFNRKYK